MTRAIFRIFFLCSITTTLLLTPVHAAGGEGLQAKVEHGTVTLKWKPVDGAIWYNLYWNTAGKGGSKDTKIVHVTSPFAHPDLLPGATYKYKIMAANTTGERDPGLTAAVILPPPAPGFLELSAANKEVTVNWNGVPGATEYRLYWSTAGNVSSKDTKIVPVNPPYVHTGLTNSTRYFYRLAAVNAGGESDLSPEASIFLAADAPQISSVSGRGREVTVQWGNVVAAESYHLYWNASGNVSKRDRKIEHVTSAFLHTGLTPGTQYYYRIVAINAAGESELSEEVMVTLPPEAPTPALLINTGDPIKLAWKPVRGATAYHLYWDTQRGINAKDHKIATVDSPYIPRDLTEGVTYYYRVAAANAGGETLSAEVEVALPPAQPLISKTERGSRRTVLQWDPILGASAYDIYWNTKGNVTAQDAKIAGVSAPYAHVGLTNGATYYYRLVARNAGGNSPLSKEVKVTLPPEAPLVSKTQGTGKQIALGWSPTHGAASYVVYWNSTGNVTPQDPKIATPGTTYVHADLQRGQSYFYRIAALNEGGEGELSPQVRITLTPDAPVVTGTETAGGQVTLRWEPLPGATSYQVYWNTQGNVTTQDAKMALSTPPFVHGNLIKGQTYFYLVSAMNAGGETLGAPVQVALIPNVPAAPSTRAINREIQLSWKAVPGAAAYNLYWNSTGNVTTKDAKLETVLPSFVHTALASGETYYYRLSALNAGGESPLSEPVKIILAADPPVVKEARGGNRQVILNWEAVRGALSYNVYWSTAENVTTNDQKIANARAPFEHTNVVNGLTYRYLVTAVNAGGETPSAPVRVTLIPDAPSLPALRAGDKQTNVGWGPVPGAKSYNIYWNQSGQVTNKDQKITGIASPYVHLGLANGMSYFYKMTAVNDAGESPLSQESLITLPPDAPVATVPIGGDRKAHLDWTRMPGATAYRIYWNTRGKVNERDQRIEAATAPYTHAELTRGATYYYRVAALNAGGERLSNEVQVTLIPDAPAITPVKNGNKQSTLSWKNVSGATAYRLYWNTTGKVTKQDQVIDNVTPPYLHRELRNGSTYYYRMSASNSGGESELSEEAFTTLAPDAPAITAALNADRQNTLTWAAAHGATAYKLYWNTLGKVTLENSNKLEVTTPYIHKGLAPGTTYYYRLSALNGGGESPWSAETVATIAPAATALSMVKGGDHQTTLGWKTVSGATEYHIYWNNTGNVTVKDKRLSTSASSFAHTKIPNGAKYYYRIAAANAGGESEISPEVSVTLAPDAPVFSVKVGENKRVSLGWETVPGAVSYNIYWKLANARSTKFNKVENVTAPHVFSDLKNGTKYAYSISALNEGGEGFLSEQITVSPHNAPLTGLFRDANLQRCVMAEASANAWSYGDEVSGILVCNDLGITDISGVEWLENVTNLSLRNNKLVDLSKLGGLSNLTYLALDGNKASDVRPLATLSSLNYLSLSENPVSDLSPLAGLKGLSSLYLNDTQVADLHPLAGMSNLQYLSLSNASVQDVRPLAKLSRLTNLSLAGNKIVDVSAIAALSGLLELDLSANEIGAQDVGKINALAVLKGIRVLELSGNGTLSCNELEKLILHLGSPPVDVDGVTVNHDNAQEGENCVKP